MSVLFCYHTILMILDEKIGKLLHNTIFCFTGRDTPMMIFKSNPANSASLSSLRDLNQYQPTSYTTTMPRGPYLQRHFGTISHDLQNNNEPPPIRPRKPPRLIHYAQSSLARTNLGTCTCLLKYLIRLRISLT